TEPGHYRIDSAFQAGATDESGTRLVGKALRKGDDDRFYSTVVGSMTVCADGGVALTARLGVGTVLPPGQHSKIVVEVPKKLEVEDTKPAAPVPSGGTPAPPRKVDVAVKMPTAGPATAKGPKLRVTLTVGERRAKVTHTTG
ncbi:MAG: hypothetical protein HOY78_01220, partial [Saccharothrix sp.]|nr:hypothetical protein [Saccharothrix sp.]